MESSREMDRPGKIMVAGIPKNNTFTEADLEKEFAPFGRITEVVIINDKRTNIPRGFAFVTYENPQDALDAIKAMEGKDLGGPKPIHCEQATLRLKKEIGEEDSRGRGRGRGRGDFRGRGGERGAFRGGDRGAFRGGDRGGFRGDRGGFRGGDRGGFRGGDRGVFRGGDRGAFRGGDRGGFRGGDRGGFRGGDRGAFRGGDRGAFRGGDRGAFRGGDRGGFRGDRGGFRDGESRSRGGFRGEDHGRGGYRDGLLDGGRGRGDEYFEEEYGAEDYQEHVFDDVRGHQRRPLLEGGGPGRPGRKTLLPDPNRLGPGRRGGPPHPNRGPPPLRHGGRREGGEEYYEDGGDWHQGGTEGYEEGYEERYGEDYNNYNEQDEYGDRYNERRGGEMGRGGMRPSGRGGGAMEQSRRGGMEPPRRGGMEPPRQGGMEPPRQGGMEPQRRDGVPPSRRGPQYGGEESEAARGVPRHEGRMTGMRGEEEGRRAEPPSREGWQAPRRDGQDDYGYQEESQGHQGGDYWDDGYRQGSYSESGGRGGARTKALAARGGHDPAGQRRRPLLGDDPYSSAMESGGSRDFYSERRPAPEREGGYEEEDGYGAQSYGRRMPPASARQPQTHPGEDRYREGGANGAMMQGGARGARRSLQAGERNRYEEESYPEDAGLKRREGMYGEERRPALIDRPAESYPPSRRAADMYPSHPQNRDYDPHSRKRNVDDANQGLSPNVVDLRRQYESILERAGMGPSTPKRERYDGYYQGNQGEVYRDL